MAMTFQLNVWNKTKPFPAICKFQDGTCVTAAYMTPQLHVVRPWLNKTGPNINLTFVLNLE